MEPDNSDAHTHPDAGPDCYAYAYAEPDTVSADVFDHAALRETRRDRMYLCAAAMGAGQRQVSIANQPPEICAKLRTA